MHPSEKQETGPSLARTPPPLPPAPPTTGEAGGTGDQHWKGARLVIGSDTWQVLAISLVAVGFAAWFISLEGVIGGLVASSPVVLLASRFRFIRFLFFFAIAVAVTGAVAGSSFGGHSTLLIRILAGASAGLMITPVVLLFTTLRFFHALHARASA